MIFHFKLIPRNSDNLLEFKHIQDVVCEYRRNRVENYKLLYPPLSDVPTKNPLMKKSYKPSKTELSAVAPLSMFKEGEGLSEAEVVAEVQLYAIFEIACEF